MASFAGFLKNVFGIKSKQEKDNKAYSPIIDAVNTEFAQLADISNDELRGKTLEFRARIADYLSKIDAEIETVNGEAIATDDIHDKETLFKEVDDLRKNRDIALEEILRDLLPEAFAVMKETASRFAQNEELVVTATDHDRRLASNPSKMYVRIEGDKAIWKNAWTAAGGEVKWNMVHYDVQLIGGSVLHDGKIAEMATGEGKTLVSTLPAYLNGLSGLGVHIVTVNNYLALRDSEWNGPIHEFLFLTVDCIDKYRPHSAERIAAYRCDITYGTNSEFGFDYLRDNMVTSPDELVQRKHHFAMVDEVDSILIDDARTPLIISGPVARGAEDQEYIELRPHVETLFAAQRKLATEFLTEARRLVAAGKLGNEEGQAGLAMLRSHRAVPKNRALIKFLSEDGMKVQLQKADNHYMQENSKHMHIADAPLLFTIDEKNRSVELTDKGVHFLSNNYNESEFFVLPDIAMDMMHIESNPELSTTEKAEQRSTLAADFSVKSRRLHSVSQLLKAYTLFEKDDEYVVMDGEVKIVDEQTGRIMEGRRYSDGLHQAIEAKENVKVGETTQTYATVTLQNFFRMYHKLCGMTGTAETEAKEFWDIYKLDVVVIPTNRDISRKDLEDMVYKTEREKLNAVAADITKMREAGRPVLVGTSTVDDSEKLSRLLKLRGVDHEVLNAKQHQREAEIVASAGQAGRVTISTNMAGRGTDIKLGAGVKEAGGLAIIGTVRHESRRVDRQLRGRAGRQGDPGSSQFYVSLEDSLMRLFQSDRIAGLMDKMGHQDGDVIQHSMVTKSIERAQTRVEENHFGTRKRLLEYDDVMNIQREAIYKKRRNALFGDRLAVDIDGMFRGITQDLVESHKNGGDYESFRMDCWRIMGFDPQMEPADFKSKSTGQIVEEFQHQIFDLHEKKGQGIGDIILPMMKDVIEKEGPDRYARMIVPFTDGRLHLNITAEMKPAVKSNGKSIMRDVEKTCTLALIDDAWKEHLRAMDDLKETVQSVSFEQKDPLVIYKMEAYNFFAGLIGHINSSVVSFLLNGKLILPENQPNRPVGPRMPAQGWRRPQAVNSTTQRTEAQEAAHRAAENVGQERVQRAPMIKENLVGRNEPCPCGSGKKYKQCHGK
jgi:preprotein translocase subunit SecA